MVFFVLFQFPHQKTEIGFCFTFDLCFSPDWFCFQDQVSSCVLFLAGLFDDDNAFIFKHVGVPVSHLSQPREESNTNHKNFG